MDYLSFDEGEKWLLETAITGLTVYFLLSSKALPANVNAPIAGEHGGGDTLAGTGVGEVAYWTGGGRQSQALPAPNGAGNLLLAQEVWQVPAGITDGPDTVKSVVIVTTVNNSGKAIGAVPVVDAGGTAVVADMSNENARIETQPTIFFLNIGET